MKPEERKPGGGLNTFARVLERLQSAMGRSPDLENRLVGVVLITVARPRGSLTRFPILLAKRGTQALRYVKIFFVCLVTAGH